VLLPPLSNLSPPGSNEDDVKTFVTVAQLAPLLERKRTGDAVGQYNLNGILGENCLNVWGEMCAISHLESSGGNSLSRAHIIPQAALKKEQLSRHTRIAREDKWRQLQHLQCHHYGPYY